MERADSQIAPQIKPMPPWMKTRPVPAQAIASPPAYRNGVCDKRQPCALVEWNGFPHGQPVKPLLQAVQPEE
jgi:hypothetical protein